MKKRTSKLALTATTIQVLTPPALESAEGGAPNPKPTPSTRVSCSGSRYC